MSQGTFFDLSKHFIVTSVIAFFLWLKYRDFRLVIITYFMGVLIDIDHLFDYFFYVSSFAYRAGWHFNLSEFLNPSVYVKPTGKVFVLLHGWEYLPILWFIAKKLKRKIPGIFLALFFPYFCHLLIDQSPFVRATFAYFFFNRLINNFNLNAFNGH